MPASAPEVENKYLSKKFIDGIYIPSGLLIVGVLIVKREWLPYAIALALTLGGYKIYASRTYPVKWHLWEIRPLLIFNRAQQGPQA